MKSWRELKTSELNSLTVGTEVKVNDVETIVTELQNSCCGNGIIGFDTKDGITSCCPPNFWGLHTNYYEKIYVLSEEV